MFSYRLKDAHHYSTHGLHLPHLNTFAVPYAANIAVFGSSQEGDQPLYELLGQQAYNNVCGLSVRRFLAPRNRTVPCLRNRTSLLNTVYVDEISRSASGNLRQNTIPALKLGHLDQLIGDGSRNLLIGLSFGICLNH